MVDLNTLVIFDPTTSTLYAARDLPMAMNGQALQLTLPSNQQSMPEPTQKKRRRSTTAKRQDKKLSEAFKQANARYRKKDGSLRSGRTQADIARLAHKLRKKM